VVVDGAATAVAVAVVVVDAARAEGPRLRLAPRAATTTPESPASEKRRTT
jgi:hypothetical protein